MEALVEVLDGKRIVHFHTHRHDDIVTVLRLAQEFGFRVVLHHVSEGWKVADEIAKAGVPCSVIVSTARAASSRRMDLALEDRRPSSRRPACSSASTPTTPITDSRLFLRSAALAVRARHVARQGALRR